MTGPPRTPTLRLALLALLAAPVAAQEPLLDPDTAAVPGAVPALRAARIVGERPRVDGRLDDAVWADAPATEAFVQREPAPGAPATERTEVRVLYDDAALYVAFRCWVRDPATIVSRLVRRDQFVVADRVRVEVASTGDGRTAFSFGVSAAGVKEDILLYDDVQEDVAWDAIWSGVAGRFEGGWTAELRIPFSQLRYRPGQGIQSWAVQFQRDIPANGETAFWAPILPDREGYVSRFGRLDGLEGLAAPRRVELLPYV
ncbi:MAG TPA: carbohydrate binding family 9 domain-containing protein, partial [Rhodothermales bacterium]|nr:carbohydrate binding family 9 domain-containing protein [Rhodothermales bacterium]